MEFIPNRLLEKYGHLSWAELAERLYAIEENLRQKELEEALKENRKRTKLVLIEEEEEYKL